MFDISTKLESEQDEISGLETIGWENHSWKHLSLIGDERIINIQRTKVCVFSDFFLCCVFFFCGRNDEETQTRSTRTVTQAGN